MRIGLDLGTARRLVERGNRVTVLAEDSMLDEVNALRETRRHRWCLLRC